MKLSRTFLKRFAAGFCVVLLSITVAGQYPPLPFPAKYAGPSGEQGQILLDGIATKIGLFHGSGDAELDWAVYMNLHPDITRDLNDHLVAQGHDFFNLTPCQNDENCNFSNIYSEVMVVDEKKLLPPHQFLANYHAYFSADFTWAFNLGPMRLPPSTTLLSTDRYQVCKQASVFTGHTGVHNAYDLGLIAICDKSDEHDLTMFSELARPQTSRVYLQGAFVEDAAHRDCGPNLTGCFGGGKPIRRMRPEIHPLDSIAFAFTEDGTHVSAKVGDDEWPANVIRWRVATFANSKYHRINGECYVNRARTTTWYLPLPQNAYEGLADENYDVRVLERKIKLWDSKKKEMYEDRGVESYNYQFENDPRDGRTKLKITVTMKKPDDLGGIVIRDYTLTVQVYPHLCIRNAKASDCQSASWATVNQTVNTGETAVYYVRGQNPGPVPTQFDFRAFPSSGNWQVKFFDRQIGGNDITDQVTGAGWRSPTVAGESSTNEIRVEVTPRQHLRAGAKKEVVIQATSSVEPVITDYVKAVTKVGSPLP